MRFGLRPYAAERIPPQRDLLSWVVTLDAPPPLDSYGSAVALSDTELEPSSTPESAGWAWPSPGTSLGRYRVERRLGGGAMGIVYAAHDTVLDREVAIKLVHPYRCTSPAARRRFVRESEMLARVEHPNVVAIYDVGIDHDRQFFVMERLEAVPLQVWLRQRPRTTDDIVACFRQIARGLTAAHEAGVTHRDFKPANVLVDAAGVPKVTDFGLARSSERTPPSSDIPLAHQGRAADEAWATTGAGSGTPAYMAPEQHRGDASGPAADQYAFFVALYEALVGHRPFREAETDRAALYDAKARGLSAAASQPLPRRLRAIVRRGLRPDAEGRHADLAVIEKRLAAPRRHVLGIIVTTLGVLGSTAWVTSSSPPACEAVADRELDRSWPTAAWWSPAGEAAPATEQTASHTRRRLDDWRGRWLEIRTEACRDVRAERLSHPLALARRTCLQQQRGVAEATVATLRDVEPEARDEAVVSLAELPEPEQCRFVDDRTADTHSIAEPVVRALDSELARADAALTRGDYARSLALATAVEGRAQSLGATYLRLTASITAANALGELRRLAEANERMLATIEQARAAGMPRLASRAASDLVWIQGVRQHDVAAAELSARLAQTLAEHTEEPTSLRATALATLAGVKEIDGQLAEALDLIDSASTLIDQAPPETPPLLRVRARLAARRVFVATRRGDFEQAAEGADEALLRAREQYGNLALQTLGLLGAIAEIDRMLGRHDEALAIHAELEAAYTQRDGPRSGWVSQNLMNEARLHLDRGEASVALERLDRACAIADEAKGPDSIQATLCLAMQLGARMHGQPPTPTTCERLDELRAKVVTDLPPDSPSGYEAQLVRARCWGAAGRPEAALRWLDALGTGAAVWPEDVAMATAAVHEASGHRAAARAHYRRARELLGDRRPSLRAIIDGKLVGLE